MFDFVLSDSVAQPAYGEPVDLLRDDIDGDVKALCLPSSQMMSSPTSLKNVSSTALIYSSSGYIWLVSMKNHAWTEELLSKVDEFLAPRLQTWSWQRLQDGLSDDMERELVLHKTCLLDDKLSALEIPRVADAIFRRWMLLQPSLPDLALLSRMKADLVRRIERSADLAVAEFMDLIDPRIKALSDPASLSLDLYNYVANPAHHRERLQFTTDFPLLAGFVYSADTKSVWRELGQVIDQLGSPVRFLSDAMKVSSAAVRALRAVTAFDVGPYFEAHPTELLALLDSLPAEHLPKSAGHWCVLKEQYNIAKQFFGRSPAGAVLTKSRVGHALRSVVGLKREAIQIQAEDVHKVERLRAGLVHSSYSNVGFEQNHSLDIQRRASISQKVDHFLGHLSWIRLLELSRKWEKCYGEAVERNADSIKFVSGDRYWNYIPDGGFVAPNGRAVRCLLTSDELRIQGMALDICLAQTGHRATYNDECLRGSVAIFSIHCPRGVASSTAEFRLSMVRAASGESRVQFELLQHKGIKNQSPDSADALAIDALRSRFMTVPWQAHAINGLRLSGRRNAFRRHDKGTSAALAVVSVQALVGVFGEARANELLRDFSAD
ncbi:MAG: hypothetical protein ACOYNZ_03155 [Rhodoferax sp.]